MQPHDHQQQIPQPGQAPLARVSAKEFAAKFQSKRECYNFLAGECEVYLPPYGKSGPPSLMMACFSILFPFSSTWLLFDPISMDVENDLASISSYL